MNVANLHLCRELYKLSGWDDGDYVHQTANGRTYTASAYFGMFGEVIHADDWSVYDLGYLLRKLPKPTRLQNGAHYWWAEIVGVIKPVSADTPEDAAAKLAIELFKQGLL